MVVTPVSYSGVLMFKFFPGTGSSNFSLTSFYTIPNSVFKIKQQFDVIITSEVEKALLNKPYGIVFISR
jgi:hypothetical protein